MKKTRKPKIDSNQRVKPTLSIDRLRFGGFTEELTDAEQETIAGGQQMQNLASVLKGGLSSY